MIKLYLYTIIVIKYHKYNIFAKIYYHITNGNGKINKYNWKLDILYTSYYIGTL